MNAGAVILIVLLLVIIGAGAYGWFRIHSAVRKVSRAAFGTDSFLEGIKRQEELLEETPKTVAGMTRLYLPRIEQDFPEFHWPEWKQRCETVLKAYLKALDSRDASGLLETAVTGSSAELKRQAELEIEKLRQMENPDSYGQVKIHRTEISRYQKEPGMCTITVQSAAEYRNQNKDRKTQSRFNMELVYVQDMTKIKDAVTAVGATCPNCGAPITRLGDKFCEYCGTAVIPVNERVWKLHRIKEGGI